MHPTSHPGVLRRIGDRRPPCRCLKIHRHMLRFRKRDGIAVYLIGIVRHRQSISGSGSRNPIKAAGCLTPRHPIGHPGIFYIARSAMIQSRRGINRRFIKGARRLKPPFSRRGTSGSYARRALVLGEKASSLSMIGRNFVSISSITIAPAKFAIGYLRKAIRFTSFSISVSTTKSDGSLQLR